MAASGAAAAAEAPPFLLNHLNDDELEVIAGALADLLAPRVAVALASTCKGLRVPTAAVVAELRRRHEAAKALCRKERNGTSCAAVGGAKQLDWRLKGLALADCTALADVIATHGLPRLEELSLGANQFGAEGMQALAVGLGGGALPSLTYLDLSFNNNGIGAAGASALGAALGRGALPRLQVLDLTDNGYGSAGLIALAPGLRARPQLKELSLRHDGIGDDGVAALVAPGEGVLPSLEVLHLYDNQVTDAGCSALVAALSSGAMPSLKSLDLDNNPASAAAQRAVYAAREGLNEEEEEEEEDN